MLVETQRLSKQYGAIRALDDLSLSLDPGTIGLAGVNGAGKSTLLKILLGLIEPTSGSATVLGHSVRREGTTLRQHVGYVPEHDCLPLDLNATEFVAHLGEIRGLPRRAARERTAEILRHVGLFEARYRAMGGYSTGMIQRVKLAQALVHDPDLILLDEPTNGLDPEGRAEMLGLIKRTGRTFGISVVLATHLLGEIEQVCEQIVVLDAGQLVHQGLIASFTAATETLEVEVEREAGRLAERLAASGLAATVDHGKVLISGQGPSPYATIRDAIVELDLGLIGLRQSRRTLADLFRPMREAHLGGQSQTGSPRG